VQGQGGAVADGFFEAVAAHVAVLVFIGSEGGEGVALAAVDGCARQPEEKGVRQGGAHFDAEVAFLRAVGFIHEDDNVIAFVQHAIGFGKLENGGDDDLARVLFEQGFEFGAAFGFDEVGDVGGVEGGADLGVEVEAIHHDEDGGVAQAGLQAQFLGGEDHQQRFARALKMPDESFFACAPEHALDDLVGAFVLLVAADDFEAALFFVGGEEGEMGENVEEDVGAEQIRDGFCQLRQTRFWLGVKRFFLRLSLILFAGSGGKGGSRSAPTE